MTVAFHDLDQRVVAAHQAGAARPADLRVGEGHTRLDHTFSARARFTIASNALFTSPYAPSPPQRCRGSGSRAAPRAACAARPCRRRSAARPAIARSTPHSISRAWDSNSSPESANVPCTGGAANGKNSARLVRRLQDRGGRAGGLLLHVADPLHQSVHVAVAGQVRREPATAWRRPPRARGTSASPTPSRTDWKLCEVATTVAPPASRPLTTCAAMEFGATPVTTAIIVRRSGLRQAASSATNSRASAATRS